MDDKYLEKQIREAWQINPSDDLFERTLAKAESETAIKTPRKTIYGVSSWKLAFISICLLLIVLSNVCEQRMQPRLAPLPDGARRMIRSKMLDIHRREMEKLLICASVREISAEDVNHDEYNQ